MKSFLITILIVNFSIMTVIAQTDSITKAQSQNISIEIYPSPVYTIINKVDKSYFKFGGFYPTPFKLRILYGITDRMKLGLGMGEKVFLSTARHSQWFISSDYYCINHSKSALALTAEVGLYSYLKSETYGGSFRGMSGISLSGIFFRGGFTWKKSITKKIFLLFLGTLEYPLKAQLSLPISFKLGLGWNFSKVAKIRKDSVRNTKFGIGFSVLNTILGRKNNIITIPFDRKGNNVNNRELYKNSMFFLGRNSPGIELSLNIRNLNFHSIGLFFNKTFVDNSFYIEGSDAASHWYNSNGFAAHYSYTHALLKDNFILPYMGIRTLASIQNVTYSYNNHNLDGHYQIKENFTDKSQSLFLQMLLGGKFIDNKYYLDAGFAFNIFGVTDNNSNYHLREMDFPSVKEFDRQIKYQKILYTYELLKEKYFIKDLCVTIGYKF